MALLEHDKEMVPMAVENSGLIHDGDGADQLVYQLVRVEEDGTVVPASEDEVIEMESYMEEGTVVQVSHADGTRLDVEDGEAVVCEQRDSGVSKNVNSLGSQNLDSIEAERKRILAQLAFLDALLQKLKSEEQGRASLEVAEHVAGYSKATRSRSLSRQGTLTSVERWDSKSETNNMSSDLSDDFGQKTAAVMKQNSSGSHLKPGELESPSSTSKHNWTSTSNESLLKENSAQVGSLEDKKGTSRETSRDSDGDAMENIGLDKLSIRELQEAFRTTFGRQTSVKDKQWLKRRLSLGLGGSREVTSAEDGPDECALFPLAEVVHDSVKPSLVVQRIAPEARHPDSNPLQHEELAEQMLPEAAASGSNLSADSFDYRHQSPWVPDRLTTGRESQSIMKRDNIQDCRGEGKRKRKPTKRYIEELTASDCREVGGKAICMKEDKENSYFTSKMHLKEHSTLGISKVKFRTGYRNRRHRPNKSGNKCLTSSSSERAAQLVRKAISLRTSRVSGTATCGEPRAKIKSLPSDSLDDMSDSSTPSSNHESEPISNVSKFSSPKHDADALLLEKARLPKKHHHPWTLREVMKLLEGVTHCGVGKWADIKKYSFSNSVFRSSTDLKDKWRNLVRASNTHCKMAGQGGRHRKHSVSPVPGPILIQVRELTKLPLPGNAVSGVSRSGRSVSRKQLI